ncbi:MAG TPA: hypothetical protein PKD51_07975 [Saprospiraceae bacterium]|nr:hypothetical protein [Saprospiraceae bacterium]
MTTFISYNSPFEMGLKPKGYFQATRENSRAKLLQSDVTIKARRPKYNYTSVQDNTNAYTNELMKTIPWIIAGSTVLLSIVF